MYGGQLANQRQGWCVRPSHRNMTSRFRGGRGRRGNYCVSGVFCSDHLLKLPTYSNTVTAASVSSAKHCLVFSLSASRFLISQSVSTMLASSRTALRQAATKQLSLKSSVRAVSAWSQVPQGPPVSGQKQAAAQLTRASTNPHV